VRPCAAYKTEDEYANPPRQGAAPTCLIHETPLDRVSEESYFFRLSDYTEALLSLYEIAAGFCFNLIKNNEVTAFVRGGLQDSFREPLEAIGGVGACRCRTIRIIRCTFGLTR